jgi:hypothetical protein
MVGGATNFSHLLNEEYIGHYHSNFKNHLQHATRLTPHTMETNKVTHKNMRRNFMRFTEDKSPNMIKLKLISH